MQTQFVVPQEPTSRRVKPEWNVATLATIEMGDPRTAECSHFGICRVNLWSPGRLATHCRCNALAWITLESGIHIRMRFLRASLAQETVKKHFREGHLLLPAECPVSQELSRRLLGRQGVVVLIPGRFRVHRKGGTLVVRLSYRLGQMPPG